MLNFQSLPFPTRNLFIPPWVNLPQVGNLCSRGPLSPPVGAFHDRSTKIVHILHHNFDFDEILSRGFSCALKTMVTLPGHWGQWFLSYSLGHFGKVTLQGCLWRPLAPRPIKIMHIIDISSWSQWTWQHVCHLKFSRFFLIFDDVIHFCFLCPWVENAVWQAWPLPHQLCPCHTNILPFYHYWPHQLWLAG